MLVSGGKILALGKVEKDETLVGLGTPDSPLGINNPEQYAQKDWVEDQQYLKEENLEPYAKKQWVQDNFLSAVPEEYATKDFVNSADGIIKTWIENNYWTSSATSVEIARQLADFGGFEPVSTLPTSGDPKKIYLIHSSDVGDDQYKEYIWNNNDWLCIGDTSMDLTPYAKTVDVDKQFADTSAWAKDTFQPKDDVYTKQQADNTFIPRTASGNWDVQEYSGGEGIKVENHIISLSGDLHTVEVTSTDESVGITPRTDPDTGVVTYDLTVPPPAEVKISGDNGISAQYDQATSAWLVGLEQANSATYMGTQSTQTTLTADATLTNPETLSGFGINTQIYGHDIAVTTDTVTLEKGMYHVDLQIDVTVPGGDPSYYTTTIKPTLSNSVLTHVIDGSFAHTETLDLSFIIDVAAATNAASLQFQMYDLPAGASYIVKNLQVCEIVTVNSELHVIGGNGIEYIGVSATPTDVRTIVDGGKLPVMRVIAGQGYNYYYLSWAGSSVYFVHNGQNGKVIKEWDNQSERWTDKTGYDTELSSTSTNAVQNSTLYAVIGDVETLLAAL
jgi:hypothetical protein